jgi:PD-(D/E)XK endonuclease
MAHHTTTVGTHSELVAMAALMATGLEVSQPVTPEAYDLSTRDPKTGKTEYYQVKTARVREDRSGYIVVDATKGRNGIYKKSEVDYIVGVMDGKVYVFPNREIKEYWVSPNSIDDKWTLLDANIKDVGGL